MRTAIKKALAVIKLVAAYAFVILLILIWMLFTMNMKEDNQDEEV